MGTGRGNEPRKRATAKGRRRRKRVAGGRWKQSAGGGLTAGGAAGGDFLGGWDGAPRLGEHALVLQHEVCAHMRVGRRARKQSRMTLLRTLSLFPPQWVRGRVHMRIVVCATPSL